jgi:hypothetical protein
MILALMPLSSSPGPVIFDSRLESSTDRNTVLEIFVDLLGVRKIFGKRHSYSPMISALHPSEITGICM